MTIGNFIGLVDKYIQLELVSEINPNVDKAEHLLRLRSRIVDELLYYKNQQKNALLKIAPGFNNY